ncbi:hypothetical protein EB118_06325 [bacterium]|nr:hypothetical protein [bacterium]NDC94372.1 hypothetical protein [bacterium]NDD83924.1 hypothetical protein [bacterium]NDG29694.1 hypothetical protein [bacterium]
MATPAPLAFLNYGDLNIYRGTDPSQYGFGDLNVNRNCTVNGTGANALYVAGHGVIQGNLDVNTNLNVLYGVTKLTETHVDTSNGAFTVTGGNKFEVSVGAESTLQSTGGNLNLTSISNSVKLYGGLNSGQAVDIQATNPAGGVSILSGINTGNVLIVSGSGGISGVTSNGNLSLTANNGAGSFTVNSASQNQNLTLSLTGQTDSQLRIESSGTNVSNTAIVVTASNTKGNIQITNAGGLGEGGITQLTGSGGYTLRTNTSGPISITSQAAPSSFTVNSAGPNQNLSISLLGATDSKLVIQSEGTGEALQLKTTNVAGNISITQPITSEGGINVFAGSTGFNVTTRTGGTTTITTNGATSTYTNATTGDHQDLNVTVTGGTNSKVNISSDGTVYNAVNISTSNTAGGVYVGAAGAVQIESSDPINGVKIATGTPNTPVSIGTPNSVTTIYGDLEVKGTTTAVESTVVTINDNIIVVNNAPGGSSDGGLAVKRYQYANDNGYGDVVADTADETGTVANGGNSVTTVNLGPSANGTDDYYSGWWIKITSGTGAGQVRRIKSYVGNTKIATVYSTSEQTGLLKDPTPVEGMDFSTVPDTSSVYALFPCHFVMAIWDEYNNEWAFICSNKNPTTDPVSTAHYSNLHIDGLVSDSVTTNTINGSQADITIHMTLTNNTMTPVTIPNFPKTYGVYTIHVRPSSDTLRAHAIFMIGRVNIDSIPGTITRIISVKGSHNDQLDMQWPANGSPQLMYRPFPNGLGGTTDYTLKITTV